MFGHNYESVMIDRVLKNDIYELVQRSVNDAMTKNEERWLSGPELCKQFQMFTPRFLKDYGEILPRKRVNITTRDGKKHSTRYAYAQHAVAQNIANGVYDDLKLLR